MELFEVTDFEKLEQFFATKQIINCFENVILQTVVPKFVEPELFFLVKDSSYKGNIDYLLKKYEAYILNRYSTHQIPRVAICNKKGVFRARVPKLVDGQSSLIYKNFYLPFEEAFCEDSDYQVLYEDDVVKIIVFLLRLKEVFITDKNRIHFKQNGYYVNPRYPSIVLPYDELYDYSCLFEDYQVLKERVSDNEFCFLQGFYQEQEGILTRKLEKGNTL